MCHIFTLVHHQKPIHAYLKKKNHKINNSYPFPEFVIECDSYSFTECVIECDFVNVFKQIHTNSVIAKLTLSDMTKMTMATYFSREEKNFNFSFVLASTSSFFVSSSRRINNTGFYFRSV